MRRALHIVALVCGIAIGAASPPAVAADQQTVVASEYVAAAAAELRRSFAGIEGRIELQPHGRHADVELEAGSPVRLQARRPSTRLAARMVVWIEMLDGRRVVRRVPVHLDVQWIRPALVARQRIAAGTALAPDMFEQRDIDVARFAGHVVTAFAELEGKRAKRETDRDSVLAQAAVEPRPPVEAGEVIRITANVGSIVVETAAVAQRDGFQGERISARLLNGRETLRVEVVGENAAKVQEDG